MRKIKIDFSTVVKKLAIEVGVSGKDLEYVLRRLDAEGIKFLTSTLPSLSKAVILSLETGRFERPTAFAWKGKSLSFMESFLKQIFDADGALRDDCNPYAIASIRQFCEYFYKLALASEQSELDAFEEKYIENELITYEFEPCDDWVNKLRKNFETYYPEFCHAPASGVFNCYRPRFGPGAFSESNQISTDNTAYKLMYDSILGTTSTDFKPFQGFFRPYKSCNTRITLKDVDKVSRVTYVAKDSRGPRVISMEPLHLLKAQMSFLDWAIDTLERKWSGAIQFKDQQKNKSLAKTASITRGLATLDLKDASDRVSYSLVHSIFINSNAPKFFLERTRSTHTKLPSGRIMRLSKVAGMGSGLTFPTMALLIHLSISTYVSERISCSYDFVASRVHVYGDDVIVPNNWYNFAVTALTQSGLQVNIQKSFFRGFFRESCGGDYYKGIDVTPVKLKLDKLNLPKAREVRGFLVGEGDRFVYKLHAHTKELCNANMFVLKDYFDSLLQECLTHYPAVSGTSSVLGRYVQDRSQIIETGSVLAYAAVPIVNKSHHFDPYKFLGSFFNKRTTHEWNIEDRLDSGGLTFGDYVNPREIKLTLKTRENSLLK